MTTTETVGDKTNTTAYTYDKLNRISSVSGTKNEISSILDGGEGAIVAKAGRYGGTYAYKDIAFV